MWVDRYGDDPDAPSTLNLYWRVRIVSGSRRRTTTSPSSRGSRSTPCRPPRSSPSGMSPPPCEISRRGLASGRRRGHNRRREVGARLCRGRACARRERRGAASTSKLLLGITGDPTRFQAQTGQGSAIKQVFLGWQQGMAWGRKLDVYLPQLAPIPMLHLGTGGGPRAPRRAVITPQQIARGAGDAYLVYLNKTINGFGSLVYVRPMAEMNNPNALYSPAKGGAAASPEWYRKMFARIFLILHGGPRTKIDVALKRLGLPYLTVKEDLPDNPKSKLKVIWNPLAGVGGWKAFYPGDARVDLVGNDMYGEGVDFSAPRTRSSTPSPVRTRRGTRSRSGACPSTCPPSCSTSATSHGHTRPSSWPRTSRAIPARRGISSRSFRAGRRIGAASPRWASPFRRATAMRRSARGRALARSRPSAVRP